MHLQQILENEQLLNWLLEDRSIDQVKAEMRQTLAYLRQLETEVKKKTSRKGFKGSLSVKDLLLKSDPALSQKISVPEWRLGKQLEHLLTKANFAFFAEKLPLVVPNQTKEKPAQGDLFGDTPPQAKKNDKKKTVADPDVAKAKQHELVLDIDSLKPMWEEARHRIQQYVTDYVGMMHMDVKLDEDPKSLTLELRRLANEIIRLYQSVDPNAPDLISRQAHRKLLDFTVNRAKAPEADMLGTEHIIDPRELQVARAYQVLLKDRKAGHISQGEFLRGVSAMVSALPPNVKPTWLRATAKENNYHLGYAKYLSDHIAPLVAVLDKSFDARSLVRVMGHGFEPDYLLKTIHGETVWGEYLGMSVEQSSGGTHYNIRSEFKKMGYGTKGVFLFPDHITRFPNPALLQTLHAANVLGFDTSNNQYFCMVDGRRDYIIPRDQKPA